VSHDSAARADVQPIHLPRSSAVQSSASATTCTSLPLRGQYSPDPRRYASSLRPLRPFARVIRFRKPQAQYLVKRLREICDRETLSADLRVLATLVELTSGDVRSCLNTLQVGVWRMSNTSYKLTPSPVCQVQVVCRDRRRHPNLLCRAQR
jgi:hypothetical protein